MKYKPTTKKYTDEEYFTQVLSRIERAEILDQFLFPESGYAEPGNSFRCESCDKILELEVWDDDGEPGLVCLDCQGKMFCCHYLKSGEDYWVVDGDRDCGSYGCPSAGEDGENCTCGKEEVPA